MMMVRDEACRMDLQGQGPLPDETEASRKVEKEILQDTCKQGQEKVLGSLKLRKESGKTRPLIKGG
jgi:hypothetical protein